MPKPAKFQESPLVAAEVQSGGLPPIEERLPENPYVIPHKWAQPGKYGGKLKMNVTGTSTGESGTIGEWFYGSSLLRFLNDGQDIGPGLLEKWEHNADTSEWTLSLRKGVKCSDGKDLTTADIMFWWNDMILYDPYTLESAPDECRSGKGTLVTMKATDGHTFTMSFDAPAPLTADRLAMWTKGYGGNGPTWLVPAHYAKNFHPKYNKSTPENWTDEGGTWQKNMNWRASTKVPVLIPYRLKKFQEGRALEFERNPYYYGVMPNGDQLPYIDGILFKAVADNKAGKVQIAAGQVDLSHGPFNGIVLADFQQLKQQSDKAQMDVMFWDSGTGAAGIFFLNYDYVDDEERKLFRDKLFRQALSIAFNRGVAKKSVYVEQGRATTGTMSPKAMEFLVNEEGRTSYKSWRDSAVEYDAEKANSLLDDLGMKKGVRRLPHAAERREVHAAHRLSGRHQRRVQGSRRAEGPRLEGRRPQRQAEPGAADLLRRQLEVGQVHWVTPPERSATGRTACCTRSGWSRWSTRGGPRSRARCTTARTPRPTPSSSPTTRGSGSRRG